MKLIYFVLSSMCLPGVKKKVFFQSSYFQKLGLEFELVTIDPSPSINQNSIIEIDGFSHRKILIRKTPKSFAKLLFRRHVFHVVETILEEQNPDMVYLRYPNACPSLLKLLSKFRKIVFITEHQTKELHELYIQGNWIRLLREFSFRKQVLTLIHGHVCVTTDIAAALTKRIAKPSLVLGNGIDVNSLPLRKIPHLQANTLKLLFVGNCEHWHGLDRVIKGLANHEDALKVELHIVGEGKLLNELQKLTNDLKLGEIIFFHGKKEGKELDCLFDKCHLAISSLGLNRLRFTESSPLKTREYCARGIPFISSCPDIDIPNNFPYCHMISFDEKTINIREVMDFADSVFNIKDHAVKMRIFAQQKLDWSIKMKDLVTFLKDLHTRLHE